MVRTRSLTHILEIWCDFACFSRPELKVERWSYPCPTPSAARGVFDAIYCKPSEFRWQVTRIELLKPPAYIALHRNEVADVVSTANVKKWIKGTAEPAPLLADEGNNRQQRQTMALRNPRFRLEARIVPWPGFEAQQQGFDEQFIRGARSGKCFQQPYLGCREFVAFFRLVEDLETERRDAPPFALDQDTGFMLYDVFDLSRPNDSHAKPFISVFRAVIRGGVLDVPDWNDPAVRKPQRRAG